MFALSIDSYLKKIILTFFFLTMEGRLWEKEFLSEFLSKISRCPRMRDHRKEYSVAITNEILEEYI